VKPIEEYDVTLDGGGVYGLYNSYGHLPSLLALIMVGSPIPYDYELGKKRKEKVQVSITRIDVFKDTLKEKIGEDTVEDLLKTLNPLEFYRRIESEDLNHLTIVKTVYIGEDETFKVIVGARAAAWGEKYKGKLKSIGKITKVIFGGKTAVDIPTDLKIYNATLKEKMINET